MSSAISLLDHCSVSHEYVCNPASLITFLYNFKTGSISRSFMYSSRDEYIKDRDIEPVLKLYRKVMSDAGLHTYSWDTEQWSSKEIAEDIIFLVDGVIYEESNCN